MEGKNVAVLVEFNYEDLELWYPLLRFREAGATAFTVGPKAGMKYAGKHSYPCVCDRSIDDVSADRYGLSHAPAWPRGT